MHWIILGTLSFATGFVLVPSQGLETVWPFLPVAWIAWWMGIFGET